MKWARSACGPLFIFSFFLQPHMMHPGPHVLWQGHHRRLGALAPGHANLFRAYSCARRALRAGRLTWNLMGMMNNPHYRVKVHAATTQEGLLAMKFEHPVLAGGEAGGCARPSAAPQTLTS